MNSKAFYLLECCIEAITALKHCTWTCLVFQWLRIRQCKGTQVRFLVQEDPKCRRVAKLMHCTTEPEGLQPVLCNKRNCSTEKPAQL